MIVEAVISLANELWGLRDRWRSAKRDRRDRVADYFDVISRCLADISATIARDGGPAWDSCAELSNYTKRMPELVSDVIEAKELARLRGHIDKASDARGMVYEMRSAEGATREQQRAVIAEASGLFRALAAELRVAS